MKLVRPNSAKQGMARRRGKSSSGCKARALFSVKGMSSSFNAGATTPPPPPPGAQRPPPPSPHARHLIQGSPADPSANAFDYCMHPCTRRRSKYVERGSCAEAPTVLGQTDDTFAGVGGALQYIRERMDLVRGHLLDLSLAGKCHMVQATNPPMAKLAPAAPPPLRWRPPMQRLLPPAQPSQPSASAPEAVPEHHQATHAL